MPIEVFDDLSAVGVPDPDGIVRPVAGGDEVTIRAEGQSFLVVFTIHQVEFPFFALHFFDIDYFYRRVFFAHEWLGSPGKTGPVGADGRLVAQVIFFLEIIGDHGRQQFFLTVNVNGV